MLEKFYCTNGNKILKNFETREEAYNYLKRKFKDRVDMNFYESKCQGLVDEWGENGKPKVRIIHVMEENYLIVI